MQIIIDFLNGIGSAISSAFNWLVGTVQDLAYVAKMLGQFVVSIPGYFAWIPSEALVIIIIIFGVVVIYKLIGREG